MARKTKMYLQIQDFLASAKSAKSEDEYKTLWDNVWNGFSNYTNATKSAYVSRYRNEVKNSLGDNHPILPFIKMVYVPTESPTNNRKSNSGRKPIRKELISDFVDFVKKNINDGNFLEQLTNRWNKELDDMKAEHMADTSITFTTTRYRNALRDENLDRDDIFAIVKVPDEIVQRRNAAYQKSILSKHNHLIPFPKWDEMIDDLSTHLPKPSGVWSTLLDEAKENSKNLSREEVVKIGVLLTLFTGRRVVEIFCQGEFSPTQLVVDKKPVPNTYDSWHVKFYGQAKTRGADGTNFDKTYVIPTLTQSKNVIYAHWLMRNSSFGKEWAEMTPEEFKNDLLRIPTPRCIAPIIRNQLFSEYWPEGLKIKFSDIRTIYAEIADAFFRPNNLTKAAFIAKILGHSTDDLQTANSNMKFYLPDVAKAGVPQGIKTRFMHRLKNYYSELKEKYPNSYA